MRVYPIFPRSATHGHPETVVVPVTPSLGTSDSIMNLKLPDNCASLLRCTDPKGSMVRDCSASAADSGSQQVTLGVPKETHHLHRAGTVSSVVRMSPRFSIHCFGGILPLNSLLFARILANTAETKAETNQELTQAKQTVRKLGSELRTAEQRFAAAGDLVAQLFAAEKRQRILAAAERWPKLPPTSVAIIASASPGYVSEVLKSRDGR